MCNFIQSWKVYTQTDLKKLSKAKKIKVILYEEMLEMASLGAKVNATSFNSRRKIK
jgi:Aspartokinases